MSQTGRDGKFFQERMPILVRITTMRFNSLKKIFKKEIRKEDIYKAIDRFIYSLFFKKKIFFSFIIVILIFGFLIQSVPHFYTWDTDSPSFYTAAKGILRDIHIYDQKDFQGLADSIFGKSIVVFPYIYWPILAQIFTPLAFLEYPLYSQLFLIINILLTFLCLYLIYSILDLKSRTSNMTLIFLFLIILVNTPLQTSLHHGQINILVFGIVLLSLLLLKHKKEYSSSFLLSLAVYLKIYPILFLILFFFQKRYRYILFSVLNFITIFLFSILLFSSHSWNEFFRMAINNFLYGKKPEFFFDYNAQWGNCSLNGFLSQLFMINNISRKYVMPAVLSLLVVCVFLFKSHLKKILTLKDTNLEVSFVFILSLIFSTISWNHHYVIMMFPLMALLNKIIIERRYNYLIPYFFIASQILYHPRSGGFPFNQILLMATILFLILMLHFHFSRSPENLLR